MTTEAQAAANAETLMGLLGRLDEFKADAWGTITDGDDGEWTGDELLAAVAAVEQKMADLKQVAKFAQLAKQLAE